MKKSQKHKGQLITLRLIDPAMTCEDLSAQQPKGKIMAWSEEDVVVVKYLGYKGHAGGGEYIHMRSETVVYQLKSVEIEKSKDSFSEIITAKAIELTRFESRGGNYHKK